ncbi:MAG: class I SAM-dependent methyltransferase [Ilumatobacter sp.]|uniref:class I SAM-dependent methyltransferase n=1 Tax=Ilumatobacter sp. TaxID=1967498 RepID=UPI00391CE4AE
MVDSSDKEPPLQLPEADPIFADPRLAEIYDDLDGERDDLDLYESIITELGASSVLDIGCGTGALACRLAQRGLRVIGLDPAAASLAVARSKPGAAAVRWIHAAARDAPRLGVDVVVMTGNVAQVFVTDEEWTATLTAAKGALGTDGRLVFETRDPAARAWAEWTRHASLTITPTRSGDVESWVELTMVDPPLVSFRWTFRFLDTVTVTATVIESDSTLRFRTLDELDESLAHAGFVIDEVRDAPDRPGREFVVFASASPRTRATWHIR